MDDCNYYLYVHTNKINGKKYVGITGREPNVRWAKGNGYWGTHFYNSIKYHGWDNFSHDILLSGLSRSEAEHKEQEYIALYRSNERNFGYNRTSGGDLGKKHTSESRRKLSEGRRGEKSWCYGKINWQAHNIKPIDQFDVHHVFIRTWSSTCEVERALGVDGSTITNTCLHGFPNTVGGYYWSYADVRPRWGVEKVARPIARLDIDSGKIIGVFPSINEAQIQTGINRNIIANQCKGKSKTCRKHRWMYINAHTVAGHIIDKQTFQEVGIAEAASLLILPETLNKQNELKEAI